MLQRCRLGMTAPSIMDDGWWLTHLWAADEDGVVSRRVRPRPWLAHHPDRRC